MNEQITGVLFKQMVLHGAAAITAQKQAINDLNVFPVPDGDTGTNMSMTIGTAVTELRKTTPTTVDQAASVTASALLRGARGNSGVILSLLFRGLSKALKGRETCDAAAFATAMQEGVSAAYKAVMKPAEGTVLTVSRLAAKQAVDTAAQEKDVEKVLEEAIRAGHEALAQTIEMNPVLKKAGVVDAVVVATRYFGGILLGGGGLIRAYSHTASIALAAAHKITMRECLLLSLSCDYSLYGKVAALVPENGGVVDGTEFLERVNLRFHLDPEQLPALEKRLADATSGRCALVEEGKRFFPFAGTFS